MNIKNSVICGDNLNIMKSIPDSIFDLIYIDPQYFSQRKFPDFDDRWENINEYLEFMIPRIKEIYRILKDTGIFILQCHDSASDYLKVESDKIFGMNHFVAKIVWQRSVPHFLSDLDFVFDTLLVYSKSDTYTLNPQYTKKTTQYIKSLYPHTEKETGRKYLRNTLETSKNSYSINECRIYKGRKYYTKQGWRWTQKTLDERIKENPLLLLDSDEKTLRYRVYVDERRKVNNIWMDIKKVTSDDNDYSTQKPLKLMNRIIKMFSNEGDLVGDFWCGSGSTLVSAKTLRRKYFGCDINPRAIELSKKRLKEIKVFGNIQNYVR